MASDHAIVRARAEGVRLRAAEARQRAEWIRRAVNASAPRWSTALIEGRSQIAHESAQKLSSLLPVERSATLDSAGATGEGSAAVETVAQLRDRRRRTIGANIRRMRVARDLTQTRLAVEVGTTRDLVCKWETGRYEPTEAHKARVLEVLGGEPGDLFLDVEGCAA